MRSLLERFPTLRLPFAAYAHLPGAPFLLCNVNTPDEYAALKSLQ